MSKEAVFGFVILLVYVTSIAVVVTSFTIVDRERESVCVSLGYDGWARDNSGSCYINKEDGIVEYHPYKKALESVVSPLKEE